MQKPQLRWPANAIQCLIETIAEVKLAERCWQKNVLQGPIECHAKGQSLQTPRPADVAATDHSTNFPCPSAAIYRRQTDFLQGPLATIPQMQVRQAVWQVSRPRSQREQAAGTQMSQADGPATERQATAAAGEVVAKAKLFQPRRQPHVVYALAERSPKDQRVQSIRQLRISQRLIEQGAKVEFPQRRRRNPFPQRSIL